MNKYKKISVLATKQRHGNNNRFLLQILAFLRENFKYIFFTVMVSIFAIWIGEMSGKYIAWIIWG